MSAGPGCDTSRKRIRLSAAFPSPPEIEAAPRSSPEEGEAPSWKRTGTPQEPLSPPRPSEQEPGGSSSSSSSKKSQGCPTATVGNKVYKQRRITSWMENKGPRTVESKSLQE
ncbi:hypothetical protein JRQ81_017363 [Phrynocephalus forsythii]|uniref:Uncharacterized protein n=1 Tax=Phrynocephalus forsythii TaxID=171643 RepID=A0A9Q1AZW6_9SAUR|nr:hypothetical protein JRQ81_017363 [Phrynocephalus forsythii]